MAGQSDIGEPRISAREAEVLAALGDHLSNAEVAARLFISIRTVESHVSSLLRKLQATDRRALAGLAAARGAATARGDGPHPLSSLPAPLTAFVGRAAERAQLAEALREHRLVTTVGPGGVGKTRLAVRVAAEVADAYADGVWYVDLVPQADPAMTARTVADALGVGERQGSTATDSLLEWFADRCALLVLDNCEHLLNGVVVLLEHLLSQCPRLVVLATSRARLLVPFEYVFPVPGLSIEAADGGPGDAVELFASRAEAGGSCLVAADLPRVAAVCRGLDGVALAIELAAARMPSLGLSGIEDGLSDRLLLLRGGARVDDRHRSLRATLDWSYALLDEQARAVLRRTSVFAHSFTAEHASAIAGDWDPVHNGSVATVVAGLVDHSLLRVADGPRATEYRALETIAQYGAEHLADAGEGLDAARRHLRWCIAECVALHRDQDVSGTWRARFDALADDCRLALARRSQDAPDPDNPGERQLTQDLELVFGHVCFTRGLPWESQRHYERAAELAADDLAVADALRHAAGAAEARHYGNDALCLRRSAAAAAVRAGDSGSAAFDLARNAELINRSPGLLASVPPDRDVDELIAAGRQLAGADVTATARLLSAEAFHSDVSDPGAMELIERGLLLARQAGDPLTESAVLDQLTAVHLARGDVRTAAATTLRRLALLAPLPVTPLTALEIFDAYIMATECAVATGDLRAARRFGEALRDLPFNREEGHLASTRLMVVSALAGEWDETTLLAERFLLGWNSAGRPQAGNLSRGAFAAATVFGLRGQEAERAAWLAIVADLVSPGHRQAVAQFPEFFAALLLLHHGHYTEAERQLALTPDELDVDTSGLWRPWYAALWAEAAALAGVVDAAARWPVARAAARGNPIASALVQRAVLLAGAKAGGTDAARGTGLADVAAVLDRAGYRYQWARTLVLMGGADRVRGESELAAIGATPMAVPPGR